MGCNLLLVLSGKYDLKSRRSGDLTSKSSVTLKRGVGDRSKSPKVVRFRSLCGFLRLAVTLALVCSVTSQFTHVTNQLPPRDIRIS